MTSYFLSAFGLSFFLSLFSVPLVIKIANFFGLVDNPLIRPHPAHTHSKTLPRAGGLSVFISIILTMLIFLRFDLKIFGILGGALLLLIVGLLDDRRDVLPIIRFTINFLAAGLVIASGIKISFVTNPFGGIIVFSPYFSIILTLIWIVWVMNMVNWSKGVDGQMPGFVAISCLIIGILSLRFLQLGDKTQSLPLTISLIVAGAYLGFLPFNFYPQKILPGYSGGTLAGYFLAVLAILTSAKLGTALLVLGIPAIDGFYTLLRRLFWGNSPFLPDSGHFHHLLLNLGWGRRRIAIIYWLISLILGILALNLDSKGKFFALLMLGIVLLIFTFLMKFLLYLKDYVYRI